MKASGVNLYSGLEFDLISGVLPFRDSQLVVLCNWVAGENGILKQDF